MLVLNGDTGVSMVQNDAVNPVTDIGTGIPCFSVSLASAQTIPTDEEYLAGMPVLAGSL